MLKYIYNNIVRVYTFPTKNGLYSLVYIPKGWFQFRFLTIHNNIKKDCVGDEIESVLGDNNFPERYIVESEYGDL